MNGTKYPAITEDGWKALKGLAEFAQTASPETQRQVLLTVTMASKMQKMFGEGK